MHAGELTCPSYTSRYFRGKYPCSDSHKIAASRGSDLYLLRIVEKCQRRFFFLAGSLYSARKTATHAFVRSASGHCLLAPGSCNSKIAPGGTFTVKTLDIQMLGEIHKIGL